MSYLWSELYTHTKKCNFIFLKKFNFFLKHNIGNSVIPNKNPSYNKIKFINEFKTLKRYDFINNLFLKKPKSTKPIITSIEVSLLKVFRTYINMNIHSHSGVYKVHPSFKYMYIRHIYDGSYIICIRKFFSIWKNIYVLLFNLFFYKITILLFGPAYFKLEILSINWSVFMNYIYIWKYVREFIFFNLNKLTFYGEFIFKNLKLLDFNIIFLIDIYYHRRTLYYLNRFSFYTIGPVPITSNLSTLNFTIPISVDNIFTHLFFVRLIILLKKGALNHNYKFYQNLWLRT